MAPLFPAALIRQARAQGTSSQVEGLEDEASPGTGLAPRVRALVQVPSSSLSLDNSERFLLAVQPLPPIVVTNALAVQGAGLLTLDARFATLLTKLV